MERYIAIDNVCAWPNLTMLPGGEIVATIFNQPCHGKWEGDVECWASTDGRFWQRRGVPAPHEPGTNRMNVAAGLANDGDLLVLSSGWSHRSPRPEPLPVSPHDPLPEGFQDGFEEASCLPVWVCRSSDGGRTWNRTESLTPPEGLEYCIPFGNCITGAAPALYASVYGASSAWFARSDDDGHTWNDYTLIDEGLNETDILSLGDGGWLAAARSARRTGLQLYRSTDDGRMWAWECALTTMQQHPGHLLRLADGRILLSFGIRNVGLRGVGVRLSEDDGVTWTNPRILVQYDSTADGGYPASVQRADGRIVTAYYCQNTEAHQRYHVGVVIHGEDFIDELAGSLRQKGTFTFGPAGIAGR